MPSLKVLSVVSILASAASVCRAADYHKTTPPNVVILDYPEGNITTKQALEVGVDGAGSEVSGDYYGFAWNTSLSVVLPNGTHLSGGYISNGPSCAGAGSKMGVSTDTGKPVAFAVFFNETLSTGNYTLLWNITYGTTTDPALANTTSCDLSRLSYETFIFNKSVQVVSPTSNISPLPTNTKEARTFEPTGLVMINSNGASFIASSVLLVVTAFLFVVFLTV